MLKSFIFIKNVLCSCLPVDECRIICDIDLPFFSSRGIQAIDKANGYIYGSGEERSIQRLLSCAVGAEWEHDRIGVPRDTFMKGEDAEEDEEENQDNVEEVLSMLARQNQDRG